MLRYLTKCRASLAEGGIFVLDLCGKRSLLIIAATWPGPVRLRRLPPLLLLLLLHAAAALSGVRRRAKLTAICGLCVVGVRHAAPNNRAVTPARPPACLSSSNLIL